MNYFLTEEQQMLRDLCKQIGEEKIRPVAAEYDESQEFPWPEVKIMAESDLFGVYIEEKYGGFGGGVMELVITTEELSRSCGGISLALAATALGTFPIILFGTDEQKQKYLPDLAAGKKLAAFAITEPEAGSDAGGLRQTHRRRRVPDPRIGVRRPETGQAVESRVIVGIDLDRRLVMLGGLRVPPLTG